MQQINAQLQERLESAKRLPSLPAVALQILRYCREAESSPAELAALIGRDPALTAKVLKTVNSPIYGLRTEVTTLTHSVSLLGLNAVRSIALGFSLTHGLRRAGTGGFNHELYWRRSVESAAAARCLAQAVRIPDQEEIFLAALLQDIGMLALVEAQPGYAQLLTRAGRNHADLVRLEREAFDADHAEVSAWLLKSWDLPDVYADAARYSHDPHGETLKGPMRKISDCVALAALIADIWLVSDDGSVTRHAAAMAREWLGIDEPAFRALLEQFAQQLPEISTLFEVNLGGADEVNTLLDQAREALIALTLSSTHHARLSEQTAGKLAAENRNLQERVQRDALTGLLNRAFLQATLPDLFDVSTRSGEPLTVLFADIDHFKKINDTWGHLSGDRVLVSVGQALAKGRRKQDLVARYGGEEFLLVFPNTTGEAAMQVAERLRAEIADAELQGADGQRIPVTISFGCATHMDGRLFEDVLELIAAADRALYEAKVAGRNRVVRFLNR